METTTRSPDSDDVRRKQEQVYQHVHADGSVERVEDAQMAIEKCPFLGGIALDSPDLATELLELAALGDQIIAAEAEAKKSQPKPVQVKPEVYKNIGTDPIAPLEQSVINLSAAKTINPEEEIHKIALREVVEQPRVHEVEEDLEAVESQEHRPKFVQTKPKSEAVKQEVTISEVARQIVNPEPPSYKIQTKRHAVVKALEQKQESPAETVLIAEEKVSIETDEVSSISIALAPQNETEHQSIDPTQEAYFFTEDVADTASLDETEQTLSMQPEQTPEVTQEATPALVSSQLFEEAITSLLEQRIEDKQEDLAPEVQEIISDIKIELEACINTSHEAKITPKMTNRLITLLEKVGYDNPHEVLLDFVEENGIAPLLELITKLVEDDGNEALTVQPLFVSNRSNFNLGKVLLALLTRLNFELAS